MARPLYIVIHHLVIGQFVAFRELRRRARESTRHVFVAVTTCSQSILELAHGRRGDQKHDGATILLANLVGSLDLDLEQHVVAFGRIRQWRAVEIAVKVRPLEEFSLGDGVLERRTIHEVILTAVLVLAPFTRCPTVTQPEVSVERHEATRNCSLAYSPGANENNNERISGQELERVPRAA